MLVSIIFFFLPLFIIPKFYILIVHDFKIDFLLIVRSEHRGKENWSLHSRLTVRCDWRGCGEVGIRIGRGVFLNPGGHGN